MLYNNNIVRDEKSEINRKCTSFLDDEKPVVKMETLSVVRVRCLTKKKIRNSSELKKVLVDDEIRLFELVSSLSSPEVNAAGYHDARAGC